jgi:hypothetical protein
MSIKLLAGGGLGNQLAEYSAARALALRRGTDLIVDTRFYPKDSMGGAKGFWLDHFPINAKIVSYQGSRLSAHHPIRRVLRSVLTERPSRRYVERSLKYDPAFFDLEDGSTISGVFLCPAYFESEFNQIKSELDLLESGQVKRTEMIDGCPISDYIGIHVRRGDYLDPGPSQLFNVVDRESYYAAALNVITEIAGKRPLLLVSDDIEWCRTRLYFESAVFWQPPEPQPPYHDLFLLSQCGALIIANSTFSWWAAWFASRRRDFVFQGRCRCLHVLCAVRFSGHRHPYPGV